MNSLEVFYCFSTTHCDTKRYDLHVHVSNIEFLHNSNSDSKIIYILSYINSYL